MEVQFEQYTEKSLSSEVIKAESLEILQTFKFLKEGNNRETKKQIVGVLKVVSLLASKPFCAKCSENSTEQELNKEVFKPSPQQKSRNFIQVMPPPPQVLVSYQSISL